MGRFKVVVAGLLLGVVSLLAFSCASSKEKYDLVYAMFSNPKWNTFYEKVLADFENQTGIKVKLLTIPGREYLSKIETMMAGGEPVDVFYLNEKFVYRFAAKGKILPLDDLVASDKDFTLSIYFPRVVDALKFRGHLYSLPVFFSTLALFYNKSLFDEAGVAYPNGDWTWDDFLKAAKALTRDKNGDGVPDVYGTALVSWFDRWAVWVWQNGGEVFSEDMTRCLLDSPQAVEAIQFYADLANVYRVSPPFATMKEQNVNDMFVTGKIAMVYMTRFQVESYSQIKSFEWDVAPLPHKVRRATSFRVGGVSISSQLQKDPERLQKAWMLVKYLTSEPVIKEMLSLGNLAPAIPSLAKSSYYLTPDIPPAHDEVFYQQIPYAKIPKIGFDESALNKIFEELEWVWMGQKKASEVLPGVTEKINELLKEYQGM